MPRLNFKTPGYKTKRAEAAYEEYKVCLEQLFDDKKGRTMLEAHAAALDEEVEALCQLHKNCKTLPEVIRWKKMELLDRQIGTLHRAIVEIKKHPKDVLTKLRESHDLALRVLVGDGRGVFDKGHVAQDYVERLYKGSREETKKRYEEMDYWYEIGQERAIEERKAEDRAYEITLIPKPLQHAKWKFMLALTDVAYNISYDKEEGVEQKGELQNTLLARLLSRLSMHERGADNENMPFSHKLRHNPAIHSLHVVALADKIFHQARKKIEHTASSAKDREPLLVEWRKLRDRVMKMALIHDMGELDGELSQGIERSRMTSEQIKVLEEAVHKDEQNTFARHLDQRRAAVNASDAEWKGLREDYVHSFEVAENTDIFIGRFFKALERIQSQQDYVRFEGLNGAPKLVETDEKNKDFSLSYVSKTLRDAPYNDKKVGPKALMNMTTNGNSQKTAVSRYLCEALESEYNVLIETLKNAYQVPETAPGGLTLKRDSLYGSNHAFRG